MPDRTLLLARRPTTLLGVPVPPPFRITSSTRFRLDRVGYLQIAGAFLYTTAVVGLLATKLAHDVSSEPAYSERSWFVGLAVGLVAGLGATVATLWSWRRLGGQRLTRLGRHAWNTDELPVDAAMRIAVLRDLERRDRTLEKNAPRLLLPFVWTGFAGLQILRDPSAVNGAAWSLLLGAIAAGTVIGARDRRRWPNLRALINTLRHDPTGMQAIPTAEQH